MAKIQKTLKTAEHVNPPAKPRSATKTAAPAVKTIRKVAEEKRPKYRQGTKQDILITMLKRSIGATVEEMAGAVGWQKHSVYGLLYGALRKKLKLTVSVAKEQRGRVYRLA